jgi:hypothetical protein
MNSHPTLPQSIMTRIAFIALLGFLQIHCGNSKIAMRKAYEQMPDAEKKWTDDLLQKGMDNEALYTLLDTLKPMSSMQFHRFPLLSLNPLQKDSALQAVVQIHRILDKMSIGDFQFLLQPFDRTDGIYRNMEIYVIRKSTLRKKIESHQEFYGKWGITPYSDPASLLAITEYENKYDRWRSYGYMFGYPDHAIDFFVNAGKQQDSTSTFVERRFFQIPVYAQASGHFTYAVAKDYQPTTTDSFLYNKAQKTLEKYKVMRPRKHPASITKRWINRLDAR